MSVKLSNSGEKKSKRINYNTIDEILNKTTQSYLKFVVGGTLLKQATNEIDEITNKIKQCEIYLMPMGDTVCNIDNNSLDVIELAIKKGYKYSIKEQLFNGSYECIFYDRKSNGCGIYDARPTQCKTFPFWDYYKQRVDELQLECPGIVIGGNNV